MNVWLGRMPWALGWLFFSLTAAAAPPSADDVGVWIRQLGGENFAAREAAGANLLGAGEAAIEPLIECICSDCPEAAWRARAVLTQTTLKSDDRQYGKIISALARQNDGQDNKLTALINELGSKRAAHRRSVALEKIHAFGGRFSSDQATVPVDVVAKPSDLSSPEPPPELPSGEIVPHVGQALAPLPVQVLIADAYVSPLLAKEVPARGCGESLTIDHSWRGGDEGLTPLCDLPELCVLSLNRAPLTDAALDTIARMPAIQSLEIESTPFSAAALTRFRQRQPRTRVVSRNSAALKVKAER